MKASGFRGFEFQGLWVHGPRFRGFRVSALSRSLRVQGSMVPGLWGLFGQDEDLPTSVVLMHPCNIPVEVEA